MFPKNPRIENRELLDEIKTRPCLINWYVFNINDPCRCSGPTDPSHITTVGSFGNDTEDNVMPLCRIHHIEWGWGIGKFLKKYPIARKWLEEKNRFDVLDKIDNCQFPFMENNG